MPPPAHTPVAPPREPPAPAELPHELLQLVDSLSRRLDDLYGYQIPQLANCPGPLHAHEALANDVRSEINRVKRDVEELKLQVDDLDKARDRRAGIDHVQQIQAMLDGVTKEYRQAVLASKRLMDQSGAMSTRDELFYSTNKAGGAGMGRAAADQSADDALMSATSDVTEGLRRTLQLMQSEVDKSTISNEMLEQQTATLKLTTEQYSVLSSLLNVSKALITSLEKADFLDRLILLAAFLFFGLCCAYVLKRRVVDKGIKVAGVLTKVVARGSAVGSKLVRDRVPGAEDFIDSWAPDEDAYDTIRSNVTGSIRPALEKSFELVKKSGVQAFAVVSTGLMSLAKVVHQVYQERMNPDGEDEDDEEEEEDDDEEEGDGVDVEGAGTVLDKVLPKVNEPNPTAAPVQTEEEWVSVQQPDRMIEDDAPILAKSEPEAEVVEPVATAGEEQDDEEEDDEDDEFLEFDEPASSGTSESKPEETTEEIQAPSTENTEPILEEEQSPAVEVMEAEAVLEAVETPDSSSSTGPVNEEATSENTEALLEEPTTPINESNIPAEDEDEVVESPFTPNEEGLLEEEVTPAVEEPAPIVERDHEAEVLTQAEQPTTPVEEILPEVSEPISEATEPFTEVTETIPDSTTEVPEPILELEVSDSNAPVGEYDLSPPFIPVEMAEEIAAGGTERLVDPEPPFVDEAVKSAGEDETEELTPIVSAVVEDEAEVPAEYPPEPTPVPQIINVETTPEAITTPPPPPTTEDEFSAEPLNTEDAVEVETEAAEAAPLAEAEIEQPTETGLPLPESSAGEELPEIMNDFFDLPGGYGEGLLNDIVGGVANATDAFVPEAVKNLFGSVQTAEAEIEADSAGIPAIDPEAVAEAEDEPALERGVVDAAVQTEELPDLSGLESTEDPTTLPIEEQEKSADPSLDLEEPTTPAVDLSGEVDAELKQHVEDRAVPVEEAEIIESEIADSARADSDPIEKETIFDPRDHFRPTQYSENAQQVLEENRIDDSAGQVPKAEPAQVAEETAAAPVPAEETPVQAEPVRDILDFDFDDDDEDDDAFLNSSPDVAASSATEAKPQAADAPPSPAEEADRIVESEQAVETTRSTPEELVEAAHAAESINETVGATSSPEESKSYAGEVEFEVTEEQEESRARDEL